MESKAIARFARIAPRKARTVVNLVRGRKVAEAIDVLMFTRKAAAPVVRKVIESALANARNSDPNVNIDELYVSVASVDKGPNKHVRRWRPRAMGRATKVTKGVSHIVITLSDTLPQRVAVKQERSAMYAAKKAAKAASTTTAATTTETSA
jgi:large subunit ribosomal protein L22